MLAKEIITNEMNNTKTLDELLERHNTYTSLLQTELKNNIARISATSPQELKVETKMGTLAAYTSDNSENHGIFLMYRPKGIEEEVDIAYVETQPDDNENIICYIYENETQEDYTHRFKLNRKALLSSIYAEYSDEHMNEQTKRLTEIETTIKETTDTATLKALAEERKTILEGLTENAQNICLGLSDITDVNE